MHWRGRSYWGILFGSIWRDSGALFLVKDTVLTLGLDYFNGHLRWDDLFRAFLFLFYFRYHLVVLVVSIDGLNGLF